VIFAIAVIVRLIYLRHITRLPFFDNPIMDASYHDSWAREILAGNLMRSEPFFRAPLYSYLLALLYAISKGSYLIPRIAQFLLGGLTAAIGFILAHRHWGRTAGLIAGILCAVYPVVVYFDGELLTESLFTFLLMLGILVIDSAARRPGLRLWFAGGVVLGLALITRPTIGLFLAVAVVGTAVLSKRRVAAAALLLAGILLPVVPVAVHNYAVSGEFIPLVWQGGLNFYLGNHEAADGWSATGPEIRKDWWGGYKDMIAIPRAQMGREPTFGEVSSFWTHRGLDFVTAQPGRWLGLMLRKVALFWSAMEFPNNQDYNFMRIHSWILRNPLINFGTMAPLALLGIAVALPRWRRLFFLYAFVAAYFAATVMFFVCARYRMPVVPMLCTFAAGGVTYLTVLARERRFRKLALWLVVLAAVAMLVNINLTGATLPDLAQSYTQVGKAYIERGDDNSAVEYFNKAIEANPNWGEAYEQLGLVRMKSGDKEGALQLLDRAVEILPELASAQRARAMIHLSLGNLTEARRSIEQAMAHAPYLEDARNILGSIERSEGNLDRAISLFLEEIQVNQSNWRAYANLGSAYEAGGDLERAAQAYEKATELNEQATDIVAALASVYARQGRDDLARSLLERVGSQLPEDTNLKYNQAVILQNEGRTAEAGALYETILQAAPYHEGTLINLGVIYAREGRTEDARSLWLRALEVNPANANARRNLRLLDE
jgi:tetratricopeptide (TPR) repeat protein